ncbi:MAG: glycosyltransferase [Verrucomicrobiota bacterium]|nr:glycosyltransferase [Verrucomicrobiota bacterium]
MTLLLPLAEQMEGLTQIYEILAETIDARARATKAERESSAFQTRQVWLQSLLDDRWSAQDVMNSQAQETRALRQLLLERQSELETLMRERTEQAKRFEALRGDRIKAQLIMDAQHEQIEHMRGASDLLRAKLRETILELKAARQILKLAKGACRRGGKCFQVRSEPKTRQPLPAKILRELRRIPRQLGLLSAPPEPSQKKKAKPAPAPVLPVDRYASWIAEHEPDAEELLQQRLATVKMRERPKFSLLVPVHDTPVQFLDAMIASVVAQTYDEWELCLVDGGSTHPGTRQTLAQWEAREPRLRIVRLAANLGIAENTNRAIAIATGEFIACLDHDDVLAPFALYSLAEASAAAPEADIFYSDEDRLGMDGIRHGPFFKPEWSPALLTSFMYLGHLTAYRRALFEELVGFRKEFDLSQDYDLALRATEVACSIRHIPHVLYHWREHPASGSLGGKPDARTSNLAALAEAMRRRNLPAEVMALPTANRARLKVSLWPRVSIIIPTDSPDRARACLSDLPARTDYPDLEIVLVTNSELADGLANVQLANASVRLVRYDKPFNFSDKSNVGAQASTGERLIFYNDDVEPNQPDWIQELIEQLEDPAVGAVAPKMLYENGKIQHAGLVTGVRGLVGTACHQWPGDSADYTNFAQSLRNVSALSAACLAMRREDFFRLGEFDAINTPIAHSDLDLCFKVREAGLRCVYTPFVTMTHRGHASIGVVEAEGRTAPTGKASVYLLQRWAGYSCRDPYFPENIRDWLYSDSPTPLGMWGENKPAWRGPAERDLLFVSHDLSWSGAPLILLHTAIWCRERGFFVVVMSPEDGPLREKFFEAGIPVIVDPLIMQGHPSFAQFAREFDCLIASTIFGAPVVRAAKSEGIPHVWWIHEGRVAEDYLGDDQTMRAALRAAELIVTPDTRSSQVYQPFTNRAIRVLHYGIPDPAVALPGLIEKTSDRVKFLLLGTIEQRKGQDVFLAALRQLPEDVRNKALFQIVGRPHDAALTEGIQAAAREFSSLSYNESVTHEEALALICQADVMVSSSRDETGPLILIEALALGTPILGTSVGGVAETLHREEAGLFVQPGDSAALSEAMARLIQESELLGRLQSKSREAYEKYFVFDRFAEGFMELVSEAIASHKNDFSFGRNSPSLGATVRGSHGA